VDLLFYLVAFSALIYVLNRDYGYMMTRLFTDFFPKEAAVLGFGQGGEMEIAEMGLGV
jgi:hypothetical protein